MKSYTDLEQSKKLAEILPLESADMCYRYYSGGMITGYGYCVLAKSFITGKNVIRENDLPCWSLAVLLDILPDELIDSDGDVYRNEFFHLKGKYIIQYPKLSTLWPSLFSAESDNPIDACYEMILELHELKML